MQFRPYPVLTLIAIPALALLISLGVWQLQRAEWKAGLIADYEQAVAAPPLPSIEALCRLAGGGEIASDLLVMNVGETMDALRPNGPSIGSVRMFTRLPDGSPGWVHFFAGKPPACLANEGAILVPGIYDRRIGPPGPGVGHWDEAIPKTGRYIVVRWPPKPTFAAVNLPDKNEWHWFDATAMERALGVPKLNTRFYLTVLPPDQPEHLARTPPATHYGYAVTWFGMAIAFLVIYAVFHARAGRLRFGKRA